VTARRSEYRGAIELAGATIDAHILDDGSSVVTLRSAVELVAGVSTSKLGDYLAPVGLGMARGENEGVNQGKASNHAGMARGESEGSGTTRGENQGGRSNPASNHAGLAGGENLLSVVRFTTPDSPQEAKGLTADDVSRIITTWGIALVEGRLKTKRQEEIAWRCVGLGLRLAEVGLTALIHEALGYEQVKPAGALLKLANKPSPWRRAFPRQFFEEACRLYGHPPDHQGRWLGGFVNRVAYDTLCPGLAKALKEKAAGGHQKHHQYLDDLEGRPELLAHLNRVTGVLMACSSKRELNDKIDVIFRDGPAQYCLYLPEAS